MCTPSTSSESAAPGTDVVTTQTSWPCRTYSLATSNAKCALPVVRGGKKLLTTRILTPPDVSAGTPRGTRPTPVPPFTLAA